MDMLIEQLKSIIDSKYPLITNLSNATAILNQLEDINWVGFYMVKEDGLYLGPFQGDVACSFIPFNKGVCGYCYTIKKSVVVPNVHEFKGHIACSSLSKSELVVPIKKDDEVIALIDIDSPIYDRFHNVELDLIEEVADILSKLF